MKATRLSFLHILIIACSFEIFAGAGLLAKDALCHSMGRLRYSGGGDWYANPTALENLRQRAVDELGLRLCPGEKTVSFEKGIPEDVPIIFATGHGAINFRGEEENLKDYLKRGGFLHLDDNFGMDQFLRPELKRIFGEKFQEIQSAHHVYHSYYRFAEGLPRIHIHLKDKKPQAFGVHYDGRLVLLYTFNTDLSDGWEDAEIHNNSSKLRELALKMGINIMAYAFSN